MRELGEKINVILLYNYTAENSFSLSKLFSLGAHQTNVGGLSPSEPVQSSVTAPVFLVFGQARRITLFVLS